MSDRARTRQCGSRICERDGACDAIKLLTKEQLVPSGASKGLFLLAPAFFMPGYERYTPAPPACPVDMVHGWNDDIVPVENSIRYARQYKCTLHVLDSDHRLTANVTDVCALLDNFLRRVLANA